MRHLLAEVHPCNLADLEGAIETAHIGPRRELTWLWCPIDLLKSCAHITAHIVSLGRKETTFPLFEAIGEVLD